MWIIWIWSIQNTFIDVGTSYNIISTLIVGDTYSKSCTLCLLQGTAVPYQATLPDPFKQCLGFQPCDGAEMGGWMCLRQERMCVCEGGKLWISHGWIPPASVNRKLMEDYPFGDSGGSKSVCVCVCECGVHACGGEGGHSPNLDWAGRVWPGEGRGGVCVCPCAPNVLM